MIGPCSEICVTEPLVVKTLMLISGYSWYIMEAGQPFVQVGQSMIPTCFVSIHKDRVIDILLHYVTGANIINQRNEFTYFFPDLYAPSIICIKC